MAGSPARSAGRASTRASSRTRGRNWPARASRNCRSTGPGPDRAIPRRTAMREETTTCCIAGGGPAGMMLGFRGDTIHPSTLELMHELRLLEAFLKLPHSKEDHIVARFGDEEITLAD